MMNIYKVLWAISQLGDDMWSAAVKHAETTQSITPDQTSRPSMCSAFSELVKTGIPRNFKIDRI
ncbi:uncharacterized protein ColSpa_10921 [Colletotrichum spaethianum]|uniref:Uncharacterized protein n=1 Tax=Colletotrichum spaethianum TaxID=700344 RepID=A0AA37PEQ7_9PEZI|nr:uncharacterized protein ColSpa_10921 [Colletotrichum spaethianum]GKT50740.1 hypothetical protein ColSpa_10921 [Colletotrichum spaethianum]